MPLTPLADGTLRVGRITLYDLDRASRELTVSPRHIRRLVAAGEIAAITHGGRTMVAADEITDYVARSLDAAARRRSARAKTRRTAAARRTTEAADLGLRAAGDDPAEDGAA